MGSAGFCVWGEWLRSSKQTTARSPTTHLEDLCPSGSLWQCTGIQTGTQQGCVRIFPWSPGAGESLCTHKKCLLCVFPSHWWQYPWTHTPGPLAKALATAAAQQCKFLIDKCWIKSPRNETNKHSIHSSAGQGEPLGWSFPAWPQNLTNLRWPDAYAFWVEGAKLWAKKCRHRCSKAEVLSCSAEAEEWDKGLSEPPEPTAWTPANGNEK